MPKELKTIRSGAKRFTTRYVIHCNCITKISPSWTLLFFLASVQRCLGQTQSSRCDIRHVILNMYVYSHTCANDNYTQAETAFFSKTVFEEWITLLKVAEWFRGSTQYSLFGNTCKNKSYIIHWRLDREQDNYPRYTASIQTILFCTMKISKKQCLWWLSCICFYLFVLSKLLFVSS